MQGKTFWSCDSLDRSTFWMSWSRECPDERDAFCAPEAAAPHFSSSVVFASQRRHSLPSWSSGFNFLVHLRYKNETIGSPITTCDLLLLAPHTWGRLFFQLFDFLLIPPKTLVTYAPAAAAAAATAAATSFFSFVACIDKRHTWANSNSVWPLYARAVSTICFENNFLTTARKKKLKYIFFHSHWRHWV